MPSAINYLDDTIVQNGPEHYLIAFYASFFAITALDTDAHLVGNPPLYQPLAPSPWAVTRFIQLYHFFYEHLATIIDASSAVQQ